MNPLFSAGVLLFGACMGYLIGRTQRKPRRDERGRFCK